MIKVKLSLLFLLGIAFNACVDSNLKQSTSATEKDSISGLEIDSAKIDSTKTVKSEEIEYALALSENAIKIVNANNGSTSDITLGMPFEQVVNSVSKVLNSSPNININSECGAGPLKFASFNNGLSLLFQEKNAEWLFAGWAANQIQKPISKLSTMAGVGIGSTRKEMESAYVITVSKTSLGNEFATKGGNLFGIFNGPSQDAKITNLWSGLSCNFR
ncbi:hypothetical protein [Pedobacter alpinus]|uniref:Uncharacterized protein n=1 Tax=Pedobacter alpinus TaxID=1590643 RepID=A0ABW5TVA2_9SPHI